MRASKVVNEIYLKYTTNYFFLLKSWKYAIAVTERFSALRAGWELTKWRNLHPKALGPRDNPFINTDPLLKPGPRPSQLKWKGLYQLYDVHQISSVPTSLEIISLVTRCRRVASLATPVPSQIGCFSNHLSLLEYLSNLSKADPRLQ